MKLECAWGHEIDWDNCVIFDLEYSEKDIIEIGALKIKNGEIIDTFSTLVLPDNFVKNVYARFNKIKSSEIKEKGIPTAKAMEQFINFIEDLDLVAHNAEKADIPVLEYTLEKLQWDLIENNKILDSKDFFQEHIKRKIDIESNRWSLGYLSEKLNIDYKAAHRSLEDCKILLEAKNKIMELEDKYFLANKYRTKKYITLEKYTEKLKKKNKKIMKDPEISIAVTGSIEDYTRYGIAEILLEKGYSFDLKIKASTSYLIIGEKPGKNSLEKASKYNVKTIDWAQFNTTFLNNNEQKKEKRWKTWIKAILNQ
ncbi:exonuclease domain-containing protein [Mesomycoplasma molare]|uniref:Exonuclease domain-containing protein n=1 Tax=Mesomycoplasma molare TaxID=171288 RepID=A0ABY5TWB6_9BACT|nr:exonuclease domain-containing protein [Mesomycoplasma molare]UWD34495.1 exonuclease domain-containing protein [Mesomycoplasma molare]